MEEDEMKRANEQLKAEAERIRDDMRAARKDFPNNLQRLAIANRAWANLAKFGYFGVEHTEFEK